jgi:hypothetical protein
LRPRLSIVAVATLSVLPFAGQASVHYAYLDGAHWNVGPLLIVDATGDPRAQEALRAFTADWNAMRMQPSMAVLPRVELKVAGASGSCAGQGLRAASAAAAHAVVCLDDGLENAAVGGPYLVDRKGHTTLGVVKLRTSTLAWAPCHLRTAVAHELGHVMGLAHNDAEAFTGGPSVMMSGKGPYRHGCPVWFNGHDREALAALYRGHAASCSLEGDHAL